MFLPFAEIITNFLFGLKIVRPEGSCGTEECTYTAEVYAWRTDHEAKACNDFFAHVCGEYYSGGNVQGSHMNPVTERTQEIDKKIIDFFNELNGPAQTNPDFHRIHSFYQGCTDITTVQSLNFKHIENELKFLGLSLKWPFLDENSSNNMLATEILARLHTTSVGVSGFLFKMSIEIHDMDLNHLRVIKIEQPSDMILKNYTYYKFMKVSMRYYLMSVMYEFYKYLEMKLTSEQAEIFESRAINVAEFLFELKKINETPREMNIQMGVMNVKSFQEFINKELAGGTIQLDWKIFLKLLYGIYEKSVENIVESSEEIIFLHDIAKFKETLQLLRKTTPEIFISAMWWIAIDTLLYQSAHPFHQYHKIHATYDPMFSPINRKQKCLNWLRRHFPLFVAHILAIEKGSSAIKEEVEEMVTNIKKSFSNNLRKNRWISYKTRNIALRKFKSVKFIVGYTDSILNTISLVKAYGTTHVDYSTFQPTLCELFRTERKNNLLSLFPLDSPIDDLDLNTPEVEVKYNPLAETVVIPMSILRFPFYKLGLDVLNYGAVGVQIAYGIARAFDYMWTKSTAKSIVKCFEAVYGTQSLKVTQGCVDGEITVFSNIADSIAFRVSRDAYRIRVREKGLEKTIPVYKYIEDDKKSSTKNKDDKTTTKDKEDKTCTPDKDDKNSSPQEQDSSNEEQSEEEIEKVLILEEEKDEQLFIRAFANTFCEVGTKEYYRQKSTDDEIPLNRARVNGVLQNTTVFARKWKCDYRKWMNPQQKCKILD